MTTYKEVFGKYVRSVSSDPPAAAGTGEIWYNTTSNVFKSAVPVGAWAAGGALSTARYLGVGLGTQTAAVYAGGADPARTGVTEEYNGSSWTAGGALGTARYRMGGTGTLTAGIVFGGESPGGDTGDTEEYNGTSWSEQNNMTKAKRTTGVGTQTAALAIGGYDNAYKLANVESYNGTSWTSGTNLPLSGFTEAGSGITSSARIAGGFYGPGATHPPSSPATVNNNIGWNGSSWSTDTAIPSGRYTNSGFGTSADSYYSAGGRTSPGNTPINTTNYWDGSAWTTSASLATARYNGQGQNGTSPSAFAYIGGNTGSATAATEEYTEAATVQTLTTS